tara:strand:- start:1280 stop:1954 length:675 start_codon:yes stop_codon:yes gene_type:complete
MSDVRINLLKEVKSAVNTASFAPTADRIAEAKRQVSLLMSYVESLEAPKRKTTLREAIEMVNGTAERHFTYGTEETKAAFEEAKATLRDVEAGLAKRRASKKRKQKAGKATPSTRVADRQERAFHGRPDSPVTPSTRKPKASVEEARKSAEAVSRHTGAAERAERKAEAVKEAVTTSHDERVASLEAKIEQLTNTLAVLAESTSHHTANEVCFSQLPFDPTTTL